MLDSSSSSSPWPTPCPCRDCCQQQTAPLSSSSRCPCPCRAAFSGYALQLALGALGAVLQQQPKGGGKASLQGLDVLVVVRCAQAAPDAAVRAAALHLLQVVAQRSPQHIQQHMKQVGPCSVRPHCQPVGVAGPVCELGAVLHLTATWNRPSVRSQPHR